MQAANIWPTNPPPSAAPARRAKDHHHHWTSWSVPAVLPHAAGQRLYWATVHGSNAEQVLQDAEGCAVMQGAGPQHGLAAALHEAGKAAGFDHPQNPPAPMTNFIR